MSLLARDCTYDMNVTRATYMMSFIYFRSEDCHQQLRWVNLGIHVNQTIQPIMPVETFTAELVKYFSITYIVLGCVLVMTAMTVVGELQNSR